MEETIRIISSRFELLIGWPLPVRSLIISVITRWARRDVVSGAAARPFWQLGCVYVSRDVHVTVKLIELTKV